MEKNMSILKDEAQTKLISNLNRNQKEILNYFIELNIKKMSTRSQNSIKAFLQEELEISSFNNKILSNWSFSSHKIENIGSKSAAELNSLIKTVSDYVYEVNAIENESEQIRLKNRLLIQKTFSSPSIPDEIIETNSIFKLIEYIINHDILFDKQKNKVFKKTFRIFEDQEKLNRNEIAEELQLTAERVRQISKSCLDELPTSLSFIEEFDLDLLKEYDININKEFISISPATQASINEKSHTSFSRNFISYLIHRMLAKEFELIGNKDDIFLPKQIIHQDRHNWKMLHLISKNLCLEFDFDSFINDLSKRVNKRIDKTYSLNFNDYLSSFLKNNKDERVNSITEVTENIINEEFNKLVYINESIFFERNTIKLVHEYAIEALEELGLPSKIEKIYELMQTKNPGITKNKNALRGTLNNRPQEIIYFGRSSTYGLRKWETEKENIKGGTIKEIALEHLEKCPEPIHAYQLVEEINKYRENINAKNLTTNFRLDPLKRIIIFNQSFVGLSKKNYQSNLTNLPKFLGKNIISFLKTNGHMHIDQTIQHFSQLLEIDKKNANYILQQLIDNGNIFINDKNELFVENKKNQSPHIFTDTTTLQFPF